MTGYRKAYPAVVGHDLPVEGDHPKLSFDAAHRGNLKAIGVLHIVVVILTVQIPSD
jgi:hypothetical protein